MTTPQAGISLVSDEQRIASAEHEVLAVLPTGVKIASFAEGYRKFFEIVPAINDALKWHNYHIRHEVYCRELGFEPIRADQVESDEYDAHSIHCLVRAVTTHMFVGCSRIVVVDPSDPAAPLPFEKTCADALDRNVLDPSTMDRSRIGEISRLAIIAQYRRRKGELGRPFSVNDDFGENSRIRLPYMTLGLYLAMIALAQWKGIDTLFMLTDPLLATSIAHLGVEVHQIGAPIEHRGTRIPAALFVEEIVANMDARVRPFFDTITAEIHRAVEAAY
jgi:N-acyl amino acid synthase of PEP-CTERM/exosortase system